MRVDQAKLSVYLDIGYKEDVELCEAADFVNRQEQIIIDEQESNFNKSRQSDALYILRSQIRRQSWLKFLNNHYSNALCLSLWHNESDAKAIAKYSKLRKLERDYCLLLEMKRIKSDALDAIKDRVELAEISTLSLDSLTYGFDGSF
ncbi:MAG: hypothetical protein MHMPM18_001509 [Marteilia pararefringens]